MKETEIISTGANVPQPEGSVAVVVPLFPYTPGLRESLASLNAQTRPPNLVVLLDDGTSLDAETLQDVIPDLNAEIVQTEPGNLPAAVNAVVEYLANFEFVTFLQAGDYYAPTRIERCLATLQTSADKRGPFMVVTGWQPVDSRRQALAGDDPRVRHMELLWAPGRAGAGLAEWLGSGHFPGPISNIFARRDYFAGMPLPEGVPSFNQTAVLLAALQGQLTIIHQPLLDHYPPNPERDPTPRQTSDSLQMQLSVLKALGARLAVSPETRRKAAAYHRAAWNSLSGVREDLLQQIILQLAAAATPEDTQAVLGTVMRSYEAQTVPAHWDALLEGRDPLDLAAYTDALRRTRDKLADAREENQRLRIIAETAQDSGWVRFGAWIGDRGARRIMELEEEPENPDVAPTDTKNPAADSAPKPAAD